MAESWLHNFEVALQRLEADAARDRSLADLLPHADACLQILAECEPAAIWLVRSEHTEQLAPQPTTETVAAELAEKLQHVSETAHLIFDSGASSTVKTLLVSSPLTLDAQCVLQVEYSKIHVPQQSFPEGARAVVEILARSLGRQLLTQSESRLQNQTALIDIVLQLQRAESFQQAASVVAHGSPAVLGDCRVSVLTKKVDHWRVQAVTGVRSVNRDAAVIREIEASTATNAFDEWQPPSHTSSNAVAADDATDLQPESGVKLRRILKLSESSDDDSVAFGAVAVDLLVDRKPPDEAILQQLSAAASTALAPWCRRQQTFRDRLIGHKTLRIALVAAGALLALTLVPATFEVEVPGQIASTDRRRIFAPENGTVANVFFDNEANVKSGQTLLQMTNADLELELRRIEGERSTAQAELASVKARRLTDAEPGLSGTEQRLEQRIQNLIEELKLVQQQIDSLTINAPFEGTVFRNDPARELLKRPVQRGQLLLEVVPKDTVWELDLRIPSHLAPYVREHIASGVESPSIRYAMRAAPDQSWKTALSSVDNAFQVVDGQIVCMANAELKSLPTTEMRPGQSVVARIHCGRRSLGFVWFREVIEFWHQLRFAWF